MTKAQFAAKHPDMTPAQRYQARKASRIAARKSKRATQRNAEMAGTRYAMLVEADAALIPDDSRIANRPNNPNWRSVAAWFDDAAKGAN